MSEANLPAEVQDLLNENLYAYAIELCKIKSIPYTSINEKINVLLDEANDLLFAKRDPQAAINIYISLIGVVEPSYVLCRFFSPYLTKYLTQYLVELHFRGYAKETDTKLLFNLFHHADERKTLNDFIQRLKEIKGEQNNTEQKESQFASPLTSFFRKDNYRAKFDMEAKQRFRKNFKHEAAVETLTENDMNDKALEISQLFKDPKNTIELMIYKDFTSEEEKIESYKKATELIANAKQGAALLFQFGPKLLRGDEETASLVEQFAYQVWEKGDEFPDYLFLKLFWGCPKHLKSFLDKAIQNKSTQLFINVYIELLIPDNYFLKDHFEHEKIRYLPYQKSEFYGDKNKILKLIDDDLIPFEDISQLLFLCTELDFPDGIIALLKRKNRDADITSIFIARNMTEQLVNWVNQKPEPSISSEEWANILRYFSEVPDKTNDIDQKRIEMSKDVDFMKKLVAKSKNAIPLFSLIKQLSKNPNIKFDVIMSELNSELSNYISELEKEETDHKRLLDRLNQLDDEIEKLEEKDYEFRPLYCDYCHKKLDIPYVGFFCGHNLHQHCCEKHAGDFVCPICSREYMPSSSLSETIPELSVSEKTDLLDTTVKMINGGFYTRENY